MKEEFSVDSLLDVRTYYDSQGHLDHVNRMNVTNICVIISVLFLLNIWAHPLLIFSELFCLLFFQRQDFQK